MRKKANKKNRFLLSKLVIIFILAISFSFFFYRFLSKKVWDGTTRLNIAINGERVTILSFSPETHVTSLFFLPKGTLIQAGNYGTYRAESLFLLDTLEGKKTSLFTKSLQESIGLPIDGFILGNFGSSKGDILAGLSQSLKEGNKTNLSAWDLIRLYWQIKKTREGDIYVLDLNEQGLLTEIKQPDGSIGWMIDQEKTDEVLSKNFKDEKLRQGDLSIAVLNGSNYPGLAGKTARVINNIGGKVIKVDDTMEKVSGCQIKSTPEIGSSYTVKKLMKVFDCRFVSDDTSRGRWDVIIIVGEQN